MTRFILAFIWLGGALFAAAFATVAHAYLVTWGRAPFVACIAWPHAAFNTALFVIFATHHSLFARDWVKAALTRLLPEPLLRSVYVWTASVLFILVAVAWRPIGGTLYAVEGWPSLFCRLVQLTGAVLTVYAIQTIDLLDLAGMRAASTIGPLRTRGPYRIVRHPLYAGSLLILFGIPVMTGDRLVFALISSVYVVIALRWEERGLERAFGDGYAAYRQQVPWRLVPYLY